MSNQSRGGLQSPSSGALERGQLSSVDVAFVDGIDEVIEDLDFGRLGNPHEACELLVPEPAKAFGNISRGRCSRIPQLIPVLKIPARTGPPAKFVGELFELPSELPRDQFSNVSHSSHADSECNRKATAESSILRVIQKTSTSVGAVSAVLVII